VIPDTHPWNRNRPEDQSEEESATGFGKVIQHPRNQFRAEHGCEYHSGSKPAKKYQVQRSESGPESLEVAFEQDQSGLHQVTQERNQSLVNAKDERHGTPAHSGDDVGDANSHALKKPDQPAQG